MSNPTQFETTETGAAREAIGTKINVNLVPFALLGHASLGLNYGATKYAPRNFERGLSASSLCESIRRHLIAFENRETIDADSGLDHVSLLASSVAMLCHNYTHDVMVDDRPVPALGSPISAQAEYFKSLEKEAAARRSSKGLVPVAASTKLGIASEHDGGYRG